MTRQEMIDLLSNALSTAQVESQAVLDIEETDDSVSVLITPTGRLILTLLDPEVESVRAILSKGGGAELAGFVVDLLLDQSRCEWCPPLRERQSAELVGRCDLGAPFITKHGEIMPTLEQRKRRYARWFLRG